MTVAHKDPRLVPLPECLSEASWLGSLAGIEHATAHTLVTALRTLYPHDRISDLPYRRVVVSFDRLASASPLLLNLLASFAQALDREMNLAFTELSEGYRVAVLKKLEATAAFRFVQRAGVRYLYDDVELWEAFGYEGASYHLGGYVNRGFDDLAWLPTPVDKGRSA